MDLSLIIISIPGVALMLIPFVFTDSKTKKAKQQLKKELENLAGEWNSSLGEYEHIPNSAIGLNKPGNRLFVAKRRGENILQTQLDLSEMKQCTIRTRKRSVTYNSSNTTVTDMIGLGFVPRDKVRSELLVEIYNADFDSQTLSDELSTAEKWQRIAQNSINALNLN